jgi:uncharacterized membrane protein
VLHVPPITSARDAVRAAIVAEQRFGQRFSGLGARRMNISRIPILIGAILVIAGIAQVFIQMARNSDEPPSISQTADFSSDGVKVQSAYPGMVMIGVGAVLLIVGSLKGPHSN